MFSGDLFDESGIMADYHMSVVTEQLVNFYSEEALKVPGLTDAEVFSVRLGLMDQVEFQTDGFIL
jgi:hypothetical protein